MFCCRAGYDTEELNLAEERENKSSMVIPAGFLTAMVLQGFLLRSVTKQGRELLRGWFVESTEDATGVLLQG